MKNLKKVGDLVICIPKPNNTFHTKHVDLITEHYNGLCVFIRIDECDVLNLSYPEEVLWDTINFWNFYHQKVKL